MNLLSLKRYIRKHEKIMTMISWFYNFPFMISNLLINKRNILIYKGSFCNSINIKCSGYNNVVIIEKACRLKKCSIKIFGNHNTIHIKNDCCITGMEIWCSDGSSVIIGEHTHFVDNIHLAATENKIINIGERCLFAKNIVIRTGDSHSIVSYSGLRLNHARDVSIGNHVWIGENVTILKGTTVSDNTVIGTASILSGKWFKANVVIAGCPGIILRENVNWNPELIDKV